MQASPQKTFSDIQDQIIVLQRGQDALAEMTLLLQSQVAVSIELVRRLVELLTPNETPDGRHRLEELLSRMIAQQSTIIEITTNIAKDITDIHAAVLDTEAASPHSASDSQC